eukprot:c6612_g1_i1.p1 GENE.c6612_g1_i1~~c6612_g1_i1.p1  ORF type:complete len:387 (+),score=85.71 c6612_g1_i1:85-1161(+)
MIKEAHIGVGINGLEGGQAALSADYAIGQFRFLQPLLLVHGHWCYHRIAKLILYSFYKNVVLSMVPVWFTFMNGYSGQTFVEQWTLSLFNVIYTALPILVIGLYDQPISRPFLERMPKLYRTGPANRYFNLRMFFGWIAAAVWHSIACFFIAEACIGQGSVFSNGQNADIFFNGIVILTCVVLTVTAKVMLETNNFTYVNAASLAWSVGGYWLFVMVYSFFGPAFDDAWSMYYVGPRAFGSMRVWCTIFIVPIIALAPDYTYKYVKRWHYPEDSDRIKEVQRKEAIATRSGLTQVYTPLLTGVELNTKRTTVYGGGVQRVSANPDVTSFAYDNAPDEHTIYVTSSAFPESGRLHSNTI